MATSKIAVSDDYISIPHTRVPQSLNAELQEEDPPANEVIQATVIVRSRRAKLFTKSVVERMARQLPRDRQYISIERTGVEYGASKEDLVRIATFAKRNGLRVIEKSERRRCIVLKGPRRAFSKAFRVNLQSYKTKSGLHCGSHSGSVQLPRSLKNVIEAVFGLDTFPRAQPHAVGVRADDVQAVDPRAVAEAYQFPKDASGRGQCIAIIELGGGFHQDDMEVYFKKHGMPLPKISVVRVDGARNAPATPAEVRLFWKDEQARRLSKIHHSNTSITGDPKLDAKVIWTIECTLDIQVAGMLANGADLVIYLAPNTTKGKYDALTTALTDLRHRPSIISMSWGFSERENTNNVMHVLDRLFQYASLKGVTICSSSGDDGIGTDRLFPQVQFPGSSPHALTCGGTHFNIGKPEAVWKETFGSEHCSSTGGFSRVFAAPNWQRTARREFAAAKGRYGVPNVAAKADIAKGYPILVGGLGIAMGGTSAAAPLWAALVARLNEKLQTRVGFINALLYDDTFRETTTLVTHGDNGYYRAGQGWSPCTGWGTPVGTSLLLKLSGQSAGQ